jgi:tellurite resistance protein
LRLASAGSTANLERMSRIDTNGLEKLGTEKLEALVEMMFLAASADGEFSPQERQYFLDSVQSLTNGRFSKDAIDQLLAQAEKDLSASSREARLQSVKQRLPDAWARKIALALAVQMTAADGIIRTSERELIMETAEALEIDSGEAADLVRDLTT